MNGTLTIVLCFTLPCLMTTLGATLVFFFKKSSKLVSTITMGLAGGIMLSASIWSLLLPSLENAKNGWGKWAFVPVAVGFVLGGIFMVGLDFLSTHIFKAKEKTQKKKAFKFFAAITIHNIPEGISVGFAVGSAVALNSSALVAFMFALGIALQNFPEGLATALPINEALNNKTKAFVLATASGLIEPLFGVLGFFLAASFTALLPWLLAFSAGAMIYVVVEELLPETQTEKLKPLGTWAFVAGFVAMMLLDICL